MSLNPSNGIAQRMNPDRHVFPNLARHGTPEENPDVKIQVKKELKEAGITFSDAWWVDGGEVPAGGLGEHHLWSFRRAWYYWVAKGPGIPPELAEEFHKEWGTQVRVQGHCGCPSPLEYMEGFAVDLYHIDTQEGLNAFAKLLESIHKPRPERR